MANIGLQEWKKIDVIAALTEDYMEDVDVREPKRQIAKRLISPADYIIPLPANSVPAKGTAENIRYVIAQRQIEARSGPATLV
jgi:hypothetical protein